jgi:hypothetical protein
MAYGIGVTTNAFRGPDGGVRHTGRYVMVWRRDRGEWWIVLYGLSSNDPS